jgi:16S rRNA (cytidine1402-2'-O)-methyltransferase
MTGTEGDMPPGTLYVVSTPIGNLEDITFRAVRVLKEVKLIAAEDTRRAGILMGAYGVKTALTSFHAHNTREKIPSLLATLESGGDVALISDSGTPGISDPGVLLVRGCVEKGITVTAAPGPAALIVALVLSGKPTHSFIFEGFLSSKPARRRRQLEELKDEKRTVIVYESPHRIIRLLEDLSEIEGDREVAVARELTKKFEEIKRGKASEVLDHFREKKPRGEFIVVF